MKERELNTRENFVSPVISHETNGGKLRRKSEGVLVGMKLEERGEALQRLPLKAPHNRHGKIREDISSV